MLDAVRLTAQWTTSRIKAIRVLIDEMAAHMRQDAPGIYSRELAELIFVQPLMVRLAARECRSCQNSGRHQHRHQARRMTRRLGANHDLNVLVELSNGVQQALRRETAELVVTQFGNVRLGDAGNRGRRRLGELAFLRRLGATERGYFRLPSVQV